MTDTAEKSRAKMLADVLSGLGGARKSIPPIWFYDEEGSRIFDEITRLPEYYPTRTEAQIMQTHGADIARTLGKQVLLIEYGAGSSEKTRILLDAMHELYAYVPVDISGEYLREAAARLQADYPQLSVRPLVADFTQAFELPVCTAANQRRVVYFPGSTIGNFTPTQAVQILRQMGRIFGCRGGALIGADLVKASHILVAAYNDAQQVTARFNLNLLQRMNRELGADFDLSAFRHEAIFNEIESRIEMLLITRKKTVVHIAGRRFHFAKGESILTEYSHKYTHASFAALAEQAGLQVSAYWSDASEFFSVQYLTQRE